MKFEVIATEPFERKFKKLAKKHLSLQTDLASIFDELEINPTLGTPLGKDCYKIRIAISSKAKGKSGGARLITYVKFIENIVYLIDIFDKSDQDTISNKELKLLIEILQS